MDRLVIDPVEHRAVVIDLGSLVGTTGTADRATVALIHRLRSAGVPIAVYSIDRPARPALAAAGIAAEFIACLGPEAVTDIELAPPPAPDLLFEAARHLGALPHRTVVIDGTEAGVRAARAGGFGLIIAMSRGAGAEWPARSGADLVVPDAGAIVIGEHRAHPVDLVPIGAGNELRLGRVVLADRIAAGVAQGVRAIFALARRAGFEITGPPSAGIDAGSPDGKATLEFALPIIEPPEPIPGTRVVTVSPGLVARTAHTGIISDLEPAYRALELWLAESDYRTCGPRVEVYHTGPDDIGISSELSVEIRVPVEFDPVLTADLHQPPSRATAQLIRALPAYGFELLTITSPTAAPGTDDPTLLLVRHPVLAAAAWATDNRHATPLLISTLSVHGRGEHTLVDVLNPNVLVSAPNSTALEAIADRMRYLLAATLVAVATDIGGDSERMRSLADDDNRDRPARAAVVLPHRLVSDSGRVPTALPNS